MRWKTEKRTALKTRPFTGAFEVFAC